MMNNSEELVLENENLSRHRVEKNQLLLVSIINVVMVCCFVFSMLYYRWIEIDFTHFQREGAGANTTKLWTNLLYTQYRDSNFLSYLQVQRLICKAEQIFCQAIFYELDFIGKLCFAIFALAFLISLYDVVKLMRYACAELVTKSRFFVEKSSALNYKNNFRSITMIVIYVVGLTLHYFAMVTIVNNKGINDYKYGVSFWVFFGSLLAFGLASVWENRKMSKIAKQEMVIRLIENQKAILRASKAESQGAPSEGYYI